MKLQKVIERLDFKVQTRLHDKEVKGIFMSDMISDVMSNAQPGNLWVTTLTHKNVISVSNLLDISAVIILKEEGIPQDTIELGNRFKVNILSSSLAPLELATRCSDMGLKIKAESRYVEMLKGLPVCTDEKPCVSYPDIFQAIEMDDIDAAMKFINEGIDINMQDDTGATPLHWAAHQDLYDLVKVLEEKGANIYAHDDDGWTPLHWAKSKKVLEYLISKGADINTRDQYGQTPLHGLAMDGTPELIDYLISCGASLNAREAFGKTPLHFAATKGNAPVVSFLISKGAAVNEKEEYGKTSLHLAVIKSHENVVEVLLKNGADVTIKDNDGRTPLDLARDMGHTHIIDLLKKKGS